MTRTMLAALAALALTTMPAAAQMNGQQDTTGSTMQGGTMQGGTMQGGTMQHDTRGGMDRGDDAMRGDRDDMRGARSHHATRHHMRRHHAMRHHRHHYRHHRRHHTS